MNGNGNLTDHFVIAKQKTMSVMLSKKKEFEAQTQQVGTKKFSYYFPEKTISGSLLTTKKIPKIQEAIAETQQTILTENNRELHKNRVSQPLLLH